MVSMESTAPPQAAVAILRARTPDSFLLMRRSEHPHDPWSGHWSFPGGRRDPGDTDLLQTALRELKEECSIHLSPEFLHAELTPVIARRRTPPFMLVAPFVFAIENELPTVLDPEEAVESVWVTLNRWCTPEQHSLRPVPGMPERWLFPGIDLNGVPVWGFTYRLIMDWLGLLPNSEPHSAGLHAAERTLKFLVAHGLSVTDGWKSSNASASDPRFKPRATAKVSGVIPVEETLAYFSEASASYPTLSAVEIQANYVRVVGLDFEEYLVTTS